MEKNVYDILKKCKLQGAIDALKELAYFARTTDKMFRAAYKKKQIEQIEKTSQIPMYKFIKDINVTVRNVLSSWNFKIYFNEFKILVRDVLLCCQLF